MEMHSIFFGLYSMKNKNERVIEQPVRKCETQFLAKLDEQTQTIVATNMQLQESEVQLRLLIDSMQDAYIASNEHSEIVDWNKQAASIFGWTRAEILGKSLVDTIIPARFKQSHLKGMQHFLKTGEGPVLNKRIELTGRNKQGKEFPIEMTITNLFFNQSHHFYAFIHDISDRKNS